MVCSMCSKGLSWSCCDGRWCNSRSVNRVRVSSERSGDLQATGSRLPLHRVPHVLWTVSSCKLRSLISRTMSLLNQPVPTHQLRRPLHPLQALGSVRITNNFQHEQLYVVQSQLGGVGWEAAFAVPRNCGPHSDKLTTSNNLQPDSFDIARCLVKLRTEAGTSHGTCPALSCA